MGLPEARFGDKSLVVRVANRSEFGQVVGEPRLEAGEYWYRVRFAQRTLSLPEDELAALEDPDKELHELAIDGEWGHIGSFRRVVAVERITRQNRSTIYAFNARRLQFHPYQYKPLLKFLDAPRQRLLIADEVGLGKTIEAGLILAELDARSPLSKVLVVCPSRLRQKWSEELSRRFDEEFEILTRAQIERFIARAIEKPERARIRGIVSMATLRRSDLIETLTSGIDFLDLVIVDEAHHARNPSTLTSAMLRELGAVARAMILLTATPLHLGSRDLFTLLNALSPTEYTNPIVFDEDLRRHARIVNAQRLVRQCDASVLDQAAAEVTFAYKSGVLPGLADPMADAVVNELGGGAPLDRRGWVDLERRVADLHVLASIVTRTRKRDVQEHAPVRRAQVIRIPWTDAEARAYDAFTSGGQDSGWPSGALTLGQIQHARQAASCLPAAIAAWTSSDNVDVDLDELMDVDPDDLDLDDDGDDEPTPVSLIVPTDSKFERLFQLLGHIRAEEPDAKILIFSFFVGTTKYLTEQLTRGGWMAVRIAGDVRSTPHRPETDDRAKIIRRFKTDPDVRVLVSSEVGSEGLDFQFCHHLVNYDLPWNPMVVEQRIGRIDRYGQVSDVVHIYNLVIEGTVEDRILSRLYTRIGIFKESIGDLDSILGETVRELQRDYFSGRLSPAEAERRVHEAELAISRRRQMAEELEENAADLFGHDEYIRGEMQRVRQLGRFVTETSMLALLEGYLEQFHPGLGVVRAADSVFRLRLSEALLEDVGRMGTDARMWAGFRSGSMDTPLCFTTTGAVAYEQEELELLHVGHPLMLVAIEKNRELLKDALARLAAVTLRLAVPEQSLAPGLYYLALHAESVTGIRGRTVFDPSAWSVDAKQLIDAETAERLLHLVLEGGEPWRGVSPKPLLPRSTWEAMYAAAVQRTRQLREKEQRENEALFQRRLRVVNAEHALRTRDIGERIGTAQRRGRSERVMKMFLGQMAQAEFRRGQERERLEQAREIHVEMSDLLAVCVVDVRSASVQAPAETVR